MAVHWKSKQALHTQLGKACLAHLSSVVSPCGIQSIGEEAIDLFVGSEGYDEYLDIQRVSHSPLAIEVQRRDLPNAYGKIREDSYQGVIWDVVSTVPGFTLLKLNRATLEIIDSVDHVTALWTTSIMVDQSYVYIGMEKGWLKRFSKDPLAYVDEIQLEAEVGTRPWIMDGIVDGTTLYCVAYYSWIGDRVYKVNLATFTLDSIVNVPASWFAYADYLLRPQIYGNYLYYTIPLTSTLPSKIVKIEISPTFQYDSMLTLGANDRIACGLQVWGTKLILGGYHPSAYPRIVKVDIATFTREASIDLPAADGSEGARDGTLVASEDLYFCLTYDKIVEIDLPTFTRTGDTIEIDQEGGYYPTAIVNM